MSTKKPDAEHGDDSDTSEMGEDLRGARKAGYGEPGYEQSAEGTEVLGDSPEDVLVLLPEGTDIPIVETEAVEEPSDLENTDIVGRAPTIPIEDIALRDLNPLAEDAPLTGEPEADPPTENLEEMASEMDDEFLAPESPAPAAREARRSADRAPGRPAPQFFPSVEQGAERARPRRRLPLAVAALLAVAATGYVTFPQWRQYVEPYLPGVASHSGTGGKKSLAPPVPVPVVSTTASPGSTDGAATKAVDVVRASKEAFREKFLLSIELGYVGEVADE